MRDDESFIFIYASKRLARFCELVNFPPKIQTLSPLASERKNFNSFIKRRLVIGFFFLLRIEKKKKNTV